VNPPQTPDGLILDWLMADSEAEAWEKLGQYCEHQPHNGVAGFLLRIRGQRRAPNPVERSQPLTTTIQRTGLEVDIDLLEDRIQLLMDELAAMNKRLWELTTETIALRHCF
jgi:hypothetical protein